MASPTLDRTSVSMAAASASTLIGFCVTALTLLLSLRPGIVNGKAFNWALIIIVIALVFFSIAIEFYIAAAWQGVNTTTYNDLAFEGSAAYGLGLGWMVTSVAFMFLALLGNGTMPYLPPALFLLGLLSFYAIRHGTLRAAPKGTPPSHKNIRYLLRILIFLQLGTSMVAIYLVQQGVI